MEDEFEQYQRRMAYIQSKLNQISERTAKMARFDSAHSANPDFVELMTMFDDLIARADELTEQMITRHGR